MQKKGDGSIIGYSGQRYGLQLPAARQPGPVRKSTASAPKPADIFGLDEEDEEEDVGAQVARQAERKRSATKVGCQRNRRGSGTTTVCLTVCMHIVNTPGATNV
jgi:hypothetical protein